MLRSDLPCEFARLKLPSFQVLEVFVQRHVHAVVSYSHALVLDVVGCCTVVVSNWSVSGVLDRDAGASAAMAGSVRLNADTVACS